MFGPALYDRWSRVEEDVGMAIVRIFSCVFPHPTAHTMFDADTAHYLNRLSHLMLGQ